MNEELSKALKDLPNRVLNVSVDERPQLFQDVTNILTNSGMNTQVVRGICKVLGTTLVKYKDPQSQQLVNNLIIDLTRNHPDLTIEHFNAVFKSLCTKELANAPPAKASTAAAIALVWTNSIALHAKRDSDIGKVEFQKLMEYQSQLYSLAIQSSNEKVTEKAYSFLKSFWNKQDDDVVKFYFDKFISMEPAANVVTFLSALLRFYRDEKSENEILKTNKTRLLDHFVKALVTAKTKPNCHHITACKIILASLDIEDVKSTLLPALQRSMLRNPEIVLQGVGYIVHELTVDIGDTCVDLGKVLIQNLYSKNDLSRNESVNSLKEIAKKCSNEKSIEMLLTQIFSVLGGSDGKITVAEYRINLLQGAGNLSFNNTNSQAMSSIMPSISEKFIKALEGEIQEKVLCHGLEMFGLWSVQFHGELDSKIVQWFKKGLDSKAQAVKISYLQWFLNCLQGASLPSSVDFTDQLLKIIDKAAQNVLQTPIVCEGLASVCIILSTTSVKKENLQSFWNIVLDMKKEIFINEKFVSSIGSESLCNVVLMSEKILTNFLDDLKGEPFRLYKSLVFAATSNIEKVQSTTIETIKRLVTTENGTKLATNLLDVLKEFIENANLSSTEESCDESISTQGIVNTIRAICSMPNKNLSSGQLLAQHSLLVCHHQAILSANLDLWEDILTLHNIDKKSFIASSWSTIKQMILDEFKCNSMYENTVATLSRISPEIILPAIIENVTTVLNQPAMSQVTDDEYFTFLTPDGELYDKSVIPNQDEQQNGPIRRENKAYSYKEQLEELQLRREIEEKKRKEGKLKAPQLTPKQKEAIKNQTDKENTIRIKCKELNESLKKIISQIEGSVKGNSRHFALFFSSLLPAILRVFKSPLAASCLIKLYHSLRVAVFNNELSEIGKKIALATIRMHKPRCDLPEDWSSGELKENVAEIFVTLQSIFTSDDDETFGAPTFCYLFEFLKQTFNLSFITQDELLISIDLIAKHARVKGNSIDGEDLNDFNHPKYLPTLEMMRSLFDLITSYRGRIQNQAISAFLDVADAISGQSYRSIATKDEIEFLMFMLQNDLEIIRDAAVRALIKIIDALPTINDDFELGLLIVRRIFIAKHDVSNDIQEICDTLWSEGGFEVPKVLSDELMKDVIHHENCIQKATACALVTILKDDSTLVRSILDQLLELYKAKLTLIPPVLDQFNREVVPAIDPWEPRRGVAITISQIAQFFDIETVESVMQFMVSVGLRDREEIVHKEMLAASLAIVDLHGNECVATLLPVFEEFLDKAPNNSEFDLIRQAVVILMGSLARHLDKEDKRIQPIVQRLLAALSTPSQQVQEAVANCIPHLIPSLKDQAPQIVKKLMNQLVKSDKYGERRGAAYGIAGLVKGLGILSLKQLDIMSKLTNHIQDKKNYKCREGALFAFEMLCSTLGRLFEPYIVHVLPHLLQCFGDTSQYVRQAADETAKVVMGKLSAHGVKLILPSLLAALDEESWRTKIASVELLGAMSHCAPKQLSSCLPSIVPKLMEVLGDSHIKVQEAGANALKMIGAVIKNPEIQAIVPVLLKALEDPSNKTSSCLQSLLETKFVHFIDPPSLALIMPVVQRAFMDRSTETRKMAAQIIGNMYSLTDQKDLTPYLDNIMPGLKASLLDPVPEVRAVSSRALGAMVRGMGEVAVGENLLPWLMQTLTSETSSVDRSGAAQGLAEVVAALGVEKLHKTMPEIVKTAERADIAPHVKDGYILMFIYMPSAFPEEFTQYIGQIINPILKALADENEYVRDTALRAGQRIVNLYAESAITLLLPELEKGLFDDNWRIRYSSVQLLGDLLFRVSGVSGKMSTQTASEDDNFGTEQSHKAIIRHLGIERRNRVLAGLYMGRSDVSLMVRQAALHVWKIVVTNTPRTLREILPTLFGLLLGCLASKSYDKRQVAARTLGDLVRKLGERVLPEIIPILEKGLDSDQSDQRQGVCIGLSEIMASTSREMVLSFVNSLVPTVRKALSDPLPEVRQAAAKTFDSLHTTVGSKALDDILPSMLEGLSDPDPFIAECTLDGLRQVMAIKSRVVLPILIPQLTTPPVNTKALSILASVAAAAKLLNAFCSHCPGDYSSYVAQLLNGLMRLLAEQDGTDKEILINSWEALNALTKTLDSTQQIAHVSDVRHAVKFAVMDLPPGSDLPGFCLPKGIAPLLPVFREAILNGMPEEKENAAQGLGEVIALASPSALQPSVVHITGPLIRILGDRFNAGVKAAVLETLAILLQKVGIMLKQFLPQLQTTFLKALSDTNRAVRMKAGVALAELIKIHTRPDPLFVEMHNGIKNADDSTIRETMLQALRNVTTQNGDKMSELLKKQIYSTLLSMLNYSEDITRSCVAGCFGALLRWLSPEMRDEALNQQIFNEDFGEDWSLRHGRTAALFVALKESPSTIYNSKYETKICKTLVTCMQSDKLTIASNGVRGACYLIEHCQNESLPIPTMVLTPFVKSMNHISNEVKQLLAKTIIHLSKAVDHEKTSAEFLKVLLPMLVNGTKEKNGYVKSNSEIALIRILRLKNSEEVHQKVQQLLEPGARDSLNEVVSKVLYRALTPAGKDEEIDDTLLS
ncbi:CLUMA_CG020589, isoform A [Clunio marinus]|uniref:CLUMA_CG020589, isoform A n=1 Tax=Clunio marinus TaxID=568069 RepID=A0A1J1J5E4_9DIPT|nr:CLUMA_CG020589, isoform A [Clunio marinus]